MSEREEKLKKYLVNQKIVHQSLVDLGMGFLGENDIWTIIQTELEQEYYAVIHEELSAGEIQKIAVRHVTQNGLMLGKINQRFDENTIDWNPIASDDLEKARVPNNGQIWFIHQNDADQHPSVPHAHNYQLNQKLDLYNGNLFQNKKLVGIMKKKELDELVRKIKGRFPNIKFNE